MDQEIDKFLEYQPGRYTEMMLAESLASETAIDWVNFIADEIQAVKDFLKEEHPQYSVNWAIRALISLDFFDILKTNTPERHWLGDILKVLFDNDLAAAERLVDMYYREYDVFHISRRPFYKYWMNKRLRESGYKGGLKDYLLVWKQTAISAVYQALSVDMSNIEKASVSIYGFYLSYLLASSAKGDGLVIEHGILLHQAIRNELRNIIENDLTDGAYLGRKEIKNISGDDKKNKPQGTRIPEEALDGMRMILEPYIKDKNTIDGEHDHYLEQSAIKKLINNTLYEDKLILLCPHGEMETLAKRLRRTPEALYVRKNVLVKQFIKKTKTPPKISHS